MLSTRLFHREMTDERAVARTLSGDHQAFGLLVERHIHMVHALAYARLNNRQDAEDVGQEAFLKAFRNLDKLQAASKFKQWLCSIVRNLCMDSHWKTIRQEAAASKIRNMETTASNANAEELRELIRSSVIQMDDNMREVLLLHYFAGMKIREIADALEISSAATAKRIERARDALGKKLVDELGAVFEPYKPSKDTRKRITAAIIAERVPWMTDTATTASTAAKAMTLGGVTIMWKKMLFGVGIVLLALLLAYELKTGREEKIAEEAIRDSAISIQKSASANVAAKVGEADEVILPAKESLSELIQAKLKEAERAEAPQGDTTETSMASISGRVYDVETGEGISGALIRGPRRGKRSLTAKTGPNGMYTVIGLKPGDYDLRLSDASRKRPDIMGYPQGFGTNNYRKDVQLEEERALKGIDFPLTKGTRITGKVLNTSGRPVPGATVGAWGDVGGSSGTSLADGTFEVYLPRPLNEFRLSASLEDMISLDATYSLMPAGRDDLEITLYREAAAEGTLTSSSGEALDDTIVRFQVVELPHVKGAESLDYRRRETSTRKDGTGGFEIDALLPGPYRILARSTDQYLGLSEVHQITIEEGQKVTGLQLVMPDELVYRERKREHSERILYQVSGRVTNKSGEPIVGASMQALCESGVGNTYSNTGDDGKYKLEIAPPGPYHVQVSHEKYARAFRRHVATGSMSVDFILEDRNRIEGVVVSAATGEPIRHFRVGCHNGLSKRREYDYLGKWGRISTEQTEVRDDEGSFTIPLVEPGHAVVMIDADGYAPATGFLEVPAVGYGPGHITVRLEDGSEIRGVVRDVSGAPVYHAAVVIGKRLEKNMSRMVSMMSNIRTAKNGSFVIDSLLPTEWDVAAYHTDYGQAMTRVSLEGQQIAEVELVLGGKGMIEGVVTYLGEPVENGNVRIEGVQGEVTTQSDGSFKASGVPCGEVVVRSRHRVGDRNRSLRQCVKVLPDQTASVNLRFEPANSAVLGKVYVNDEPAVAIRVDVFVTTSYGEEDDDQSFGGNEFHVGDLPAGTAKLVVKATNTLDRNTEELRERTVTVELREGETTVRDIRF
ncbi:sigma-70 family RNA polymerase sigma factor [Candidatus Hydrogenedentota bacterium]